MRRLPLLMLLGAVCTVLAGCVVPPPIATRAAVVNEYHAYLAQGTASITGEAFLTTKGGDVKRAAGYKVSADPLTPYLQEWYAEAQGRWWFSPPDTLFLHARRETKADVDGRFEFTGLPAGLYVLSTSIFWDVPSRFGSTVTGGWLVDTVRVNEGQKRTIIMNTIHDMCDSFLVNVKKSPCLLTKQRM